MNLSGITGKAKECRLSYLTKILGLRFNIGLRFSFSNVLEIKDHSSGTVSIHLLYTITEIENV